MTPLRKRLFNPPNAVPDPGFEISRPPRTGVKGTDSRLRLVLPPLPVKPPFHWPGNLCGEFWLADECAPDIRPPTVGEVQKAVTKLWKLTLAELAGPRRYGYLIPPRQIAMAIAYRLTGRSLPFIGKMFGGRDHTTVLHAVRKMRPYIEAAATQLPREASPAEWAKAMKGRVPQ